MYGFSLVVLYASIVFNIPLARQFVNGSVGTFVDDRLSKRIKLGKFNPFFVGYFSEYKKMKEIYDIEFVIQLIAYICTFINIILGVLSPIFHGKHPNEIWAWLDIVFGLLFVLIFILIFMSYGFISEIIFPYILEIPMSKIKEAEQKIEFFEKQLKESIEIKDKNKTMEILSKRNCWLLRRYKITYGKFYFDKKTREYNYYGNPPIFRFSSYILDYRKKS